jgi:hypothetical protein
MLESKKKQRKITVDPNSLFAGISDIKAAMKEAEC